MNRIKVVDFLYYAYLFVVVLLSTIGMSSGNAMYVLFVLTGSIFVITRILSNEYDPKYLLVVVASVSLGVLAYLVSHRFTLLLTALLLVGAKGLEVRTLIGVFLSAKIAGLVLVVLFVASGVFEVELYQYYKMAVDGYLTRIRINGSSLNVMHLSFLAIIFLSFYLLRGRFNVLHYALFLTANSIIETLTNSYIGLFLGTGGLALCLLCQYSSSFRKRFVKWSTAIIPLLIALSFGTAFLYGGTLIDTLDRLFQGRIYYNHFLLTNYPPTLFGRGVLGIEANYDNSFVFIFVAYGILVFLLLFGLMQKLVAQLKQENDWTALVIVVIYLIAALSESFYPAAAVNPSLFFLVAMLGCSLPRGARRCGVISRDRYFQNNEHAKEGPKR